jgi:two-component system, sporulation sensor kinase E
MKPGFLDKLVKRMDRLEPADVQHVILRLINERGFLEKVFEALQDGLILLDANGAVTYVNRAACTFFGFDRDAIIGQRLRDNVHDLDLQSLARSGGAVSRDLEIFYPENRYLNFYVTAIDEREDLGFVMLIRDITQTRKLTEEKIESERISALTLLAAGVAHELGNPLNSLTIHLQLLERQLRRPKAKDPAKLLEHLDIAQAELKRLDSIIRDFLAAIRPTHPQFQRASLQDLIEESVRFLSPELKQARIAVQVDIQNAVPAMPLDINQMKQALHNLIRNSVQAMPDGGALTINCSYNDSEVRLSIRDTGRGISSESMSNVFQPFFTTRKTGSGLGLLIVRRIVREHGGELEIESKEGAGTEVTMMLPLVEKRVRLLKAPIDAGDSPAGSGDAESHEQTP